MRHIYVLEQVIKNKNGFFTKLVLRRILPDEDVSAEKLCLMVRMHTPEDLVGLRYRVLFPIIKWLLGIMAPEVAYSEHMKRELKGDM